ncbi:MAG: hypothetical protein DI592_19645, partial [Stenotrophomonas maltophilia]
RVVGNIMGGLLLGILLSRPVSSLVAEVFGWRGVFAQDIPDGPGAGTELALQGRSEFAFEDGHIVRIIDRS